MTRDDDFFQAPVADVASVTSQPSDHPVLETLRQLNPSPRVYAQMMTQVYKSSGGTPPDGWAYLTDSDVEGFSNDGYFSVAYVNDTTRQLVIAHRGTEPTDLGDIRSDIVLTLARIPSQFNDGAEPFMTRARDRYKQRFNNTLEIAEADVLHTGHSLGAVLAELSAYRFHGAAVTFDSPGSLPIIRKEFDANVKPEDVNVITFQAAPQAINRVNEHVGHIYRIYPPFEDTILFEPANVFQQHSSVGLLAQFSPSTNIPFVVSDQGIGDWSGLSPGNLLFEWDFDYNPHFVWGIRFGNYNSAYKKAILNSSYYGGGVQNPAPPGNEIVGDGTSNKLWGDTTGDDKLIPGANADEVFSYGGDDDIQLGVNGAPDGSGDTVRIITAPGTTGARQVRNPDGSDLLVWDDLPVQGLSLAQPDGSYQLTAGERVFTLRLGGDTLLIEPDGDTQNSVTVYHFYEGALGIYLDLNSVIACAQGKEIVGSTQTADDITGTCGPDVIYADGDENDVSAVRNLNDRVRAGAGNDVVYARYLGDGSGTSAISEVNEIDLGPGDDRAIGATGANDTNVIHGGPGKDRLDGHHGTTAYGDEGADVIAGAGEAHGGVGDDLIYWFRVYEQGDYRADGGPGDDYINGAFQGERASVIEMNGGLGNDILLVDSYPPYFAQPVADNNTYILRGQEGLNTYVLHPDLFKRGAKIFIEPGPDEFRVPSEEAQARLAIWVYEFIIYDPLDPRLFNPDHLGPNTTARRVQDYPGVQMQYDPSTKQLTATLQSSAVTASTEATPQESGQIVIENFHNGMFGITGVTGAPELPVQAPENPIYLPIINKAAMQTEDGNVQGVAAVDTRHPLAAEHPEYVAHTAAPPYHDISGVASGLLYGGVAATAMLPPGVKSTIHNTLNGLQTEIDVAQYHADKALERAKDWFQERLGR